MRWWRRSRPAGDARPTDVPGDDPDADPDADPDGYVPVPRPSVRELGQDWMRALTLTTSAKPGTTIDELFDQIRTVNQPGNQALALRTPLAAADVAALNDVQAWNAEIRSTEHKLHLALDLQLIGWLAEATGESRAAVVQRLALHLETLLPPP